MRVSDASRFEANQTAIQNSLARLNGAQRAISTGKRIMLPSDSPLDAAFATRLRSQKDDSDRHLRSIGDAKAWLSVQDSALQSSSSLLARVKELSVQAVNASLGPEGRDAIATELDGIRNQLGLLANTTYQGQSVFGGFSTQAVDLTDTSATFNGTPGARVERRVSDNQVIAVNTDGNTAFGFDTGDDVFSVIARLSSNIRADDATAIAADSATLDERATGLRDALGVIGTRAQLVDSTASRHEDDKVTIGSRLSEIEDTDMTEAAVYLAQASQAYESILAMIAKTQQTSLLNFLH